MKQCKRCGSFAVNPHLHGREKGKDLHLCDVCYWRKRAESSKHSIPIPVIPVNEKIDAEIDAYFSKVHKKKIRGTK